MSNDIVVKHWSRISMAVEESIPEGVQKLVDMATLNMV